MKTMAPLNLKRATFAATALLAGFLSSAQAQNTPVGPWDVVLSGPQRGLMQITFVADFTLNGFEIITQKPRSAHASDDADVRTPDGSDSRGGADSGSSLITTIYGGASLDGTWTYDNRGRVIGVINEVGETGTNAISFTATVRPGSRINMVGHRDGRRISYRGVPVAALADFSGNYYSNGTRAGKPFTELYTLTPGTDPNTYDIVGTGPNYGLAGTLLVSGQKRVAIYTATTETTNGLIRSVTGSFNLSTGSGNVLGLSQDPAGGGQAVNVKASVIKQ
jgi:hypothetical protein